MIEPSYGSDQHGLIWGYRFSPGKAAQPVTSEEAVEAIGTISFEPSDDFFWLHFSLANSASESWLRQHFSLPPAFFDTLQTTVGATRLEQDDDFLVAIIQDVLFGSKFDAAAVGSTSLCIGPRLLLSARLRPLRSVDQLRGAVRTGHVFRSPVELLAHLLREQASVLAEILRRSTAHVDEVEDKFLAQHSFASRGELGSLRRSLVRLQRLLAPEPAALFRLLNRPLEWISEDDLRDLRGAAEEFAAAIHDTTAVVERVKLIQEELAALNNEETGRTLFVLTIVTVLALPINLIAGLFGMNVGGIPFTDNNGGFFIIVGTLMLLTAILGYLALGKRKR
jgi:zinc transporter